MGKGWEGWESKFTLFWTWLCKVKNWKALRVDLPKSVHWFPFCIIIKNNNTKNQVLYLQCDSTEMNIQRWKLKGLLQYCALKETFPITRNANTNVGTWVSLHEEKNNYSLYTLSWTCWTRVGVPRAKCEWVYRRLNGRGSKFYYSWTGRCGKSYRMVWKVVGTPYRTKRWNHD